VAPGSGSGSRLVEMLDALRREFEVLSQDASVFRMQKDEYDRKSKY
jgi:hypothetical protein